MYGAGAKVFWSFLFDTQFLFSYSYMLENPRLLNLGVNGILSKRSQVEPGGAERFPAWPSMVKIHARHATDLKPQALARGVGSLAQELSAPE